MTPLEEKEQIKKGNEYYWRENTKKASQVYINKMGNLAEGIEIQEKLLEGFYRDDSYFGNRAPHHIIYKLGKPLISNDKKRAYEFLIEYDIYEPSTGIYYGCKGVTINGDHDYNIQKFNQEWDDIRHTTGIVLSNIFPGKRFNLRFKRTNNANNNTYWPFWITLYEEEDVIGVAARAVRSIKEIYRYELGMKEDEDIVYSISGAILDMDGMINKEKNSKDTDKDNDETETAFTNEACDKLTMKLQGRTTFNEIANTLEKQKMIAAEEKYYEKAWRLQPDISQTDFVIQIKEVFEEYGLKCPWKYIERVILNADGLSMEDRLRQSRNEASNHKTEDKRRKRKTINERK